MLVLSQIRAYIRKLVSIQQSKLPKRMKTSRILVRRTSEVIARVEVSSAHEHCSEVCQLGEVGLWIYHFKSAATIKRIK